MKISIVNGKGSAMTEGRGFLIFVIEFREFVFLLLKVCLRVIVFNWGRENRII